MINIIILLTTHTNIISITHNYDTISYCIVELKYKPHTICLSETA